MTVRERDNEKRHLGPVFSCRRRLRKRAAIPVVG